MNETFAIGIPTINCADILVPALQRYYNDFPTTFFVIVDNGSQEIPVNSRTTLLRYGRNLGVPTSWNAMARHIFYKHNIRNIFLLNDDIYWGKREKEVIQFVEINASQDFIAATGEWCNFLLPQDTFETVGEFDEQIMAYHEDNDFDYRMKLLDIIPASSPFLYPDEFKRSMSQKKDPTLKQYFQLSREYYKRKWGGYPGKETFKTPFGLKELYGV
jgi:GT2 family glycosyltransferase